MAEAKVDPAVVDPENARKKVWVVRVPPYVAKQWREALASAEKLEDGADGANRADEARKDNLLGQLTLEEGNPTMLRVQGPHGEEVLYMNPNRDTADATVLSYGVADNGAIVDAKVEGIAFKRFDAAPVKLSEGARTPGSLAAEQQRQQSSAAGQVDSDYLKQTRARLAAAAKPVQKRKVAMLEDDHEINQLAGGTKDLPLYVKNRQKKKAQAATTGIKRVKMTKDELESELFNLFAMQQYWHFTQLQKTLDQPVATIKEVLATLADQCKAGPNKDLWGLKAHFKSASVQQRQAAAAAAAGGGGG